MENLEKPEEMVMAKNRNFQKMSRIVFRKKVIFWDTLDGSWLGLEIRRTKAHNLAENVNKPLKTVKLEEHLESGKTENGYWKTARKVENGLTENVE